MAFFEDMSGIRAFLDDEDDEGKTPKMYNEFTKKVLAYAQEKKTFTVPELQMEFSVNYYQAMNAVNDLIQGKDVEFDTGVIYKCILAEESDSEKKESSDNSHDDFAAFLKKRREQLKRMSNMAWLDEDEDDEDDEEDDEDDEEDDEDDEEDDEDDDSTDTVIYMEDLMALYIKALAIVVRTGNVSVSLVQRECAVGYDRACGMIKWMERLGYVSPPDSETKAQKVLLTKEKFEAKYGPLD